MKVRLVGGPFGGKVKTIRLPGSGGEIIMRGPKRMTRKQKFEYLSDSSNKFSWHMAPGGMLARGDLPQVEARYRPAYRIHQIGDEYANLICTHPDGSLFYEYVKDSKREY